MKSFKNILHILLTFASVLGFLGGWATLAHSRKPVQPGSGQSQTSQTVVDPLPPLAPIPAMDASSANNNNNSGSGLLNIITPPTQAAPVMPLRRTRSIFTTTGS